MSAEKWRVDVARDLQKRSYYHGVLAESDAMEMLQRDGDFVVRQAPTANTASTRIVLHDGSVAVAGAFVLTTRWGYAGGKPHLYNVEIKRHKNTKFYVIPAKKYDTIMDLVTDLVETRATIPCGRDNVQLARPIELEPWELQHKDIKLERVIGAGSFGHVWKGHLRLANHWVPVAVKEHLQLDEPGMDVELIEMLREARVLRELKHDNLVKYYGIAIREEPMYLVMELVADGDVGTFMRRRAKGQGGQPRPVSKVFRVSMLLDAAKGLAYMHSLTPPCLHRDIASRNALIDEIKRQVKLTDFGLTRRGQYYRQSPEKQGMPLRWCQSQTLLGGSRPADARVPVPVPVPKAHSPASTTGTATATENTDESRWSETAPRVGPPPAPTQEATTSKPPPPPPRAKRMSRSVVPKPTVFSSLAKIPGEMSRGASRFRRRSIDRSTPMSKGAHSRSQGLGVPPGPNPSAFVRRSQKVETRES